MSRKKAVKGKHAGSGPTGKANAGVKSGSLVQANGVVHPSRPALSNSSEFYDIAFKASTHSDSKAFFTAKQQATLTTSTFYSR